MAAGPGPSMGGGVLTQLLHGSCSHADVLTDPDMARAVDAGEFVCAWAWGVCVCVLRGGTDRLAGTDIWVYLLWAPVEAAMEGDPPQCLS